jgi:hypothetical protein
MNPGEPIMKPVPVSDVGAAAVEMTMLLIWGPSWA